MKKFFHNLFLYKTENPWLQFFRYFFSGFSAFVVYFSLLYLLTEFGHIYHMISLICAYLISIGVNFLISKYFVFASRVQHSSRVQMVKFVSVALVGLVMQYFIVLFLNALQIPYLFANVIASALIYIVSFTLNRLFTFRS